MFSLYIYMSPMGCCFRAALKEFGVEEISLYIYMRLTILLYILISSMKYPFSTRKFRQLLADFTVEQRSV